MKNRNEASFRALYPIVIGFGGNDGSLMGTLEGLPMGVPESIYWCQRDGSPLSPRVTKLLEEKRGNLVIIPGFDELMLKIQDHMRSAWGMPDLLTEMEKRQRDREKSYHDQRERIATALTVQAKEAVTKTEDQPAARKVETSEERDLADAAVRLLAPTEKAWWQWVMEAEREQDVDRKNAIFEKALEQLEQEPNLLGFYAKFLAEERKDFDRAEDFYKRALELDPNHANNLGNYALLGGKRKDFDRAEDFYKRAIQAAPEHANNLGNYALFLDDDRKDFDRAEEFYKRALEVDPSHSNNLSNYAIFLSDRRKNSDRAEEFHNRSIEIDPDRPNILGGYAVFLANERNDVDRAQEFYTRALKAEPNRANTLGNYAGLLLSLGNTTQGFELLGRAETLVENPALSVELAFYRLAHDPQKRTEHLASLKGLLRSGARSPGWAFDRNIERARKDGFPNVSLLVALAKVINDEAPLSSLDAFGDRV
ncbi:MAG TPA: tetratricopeptide repeat protein [Chthoniobacterales bacterium]|nr:tetratricopeptide repeat protein [Chthoniobacterales bacterium]